MLDLPKDYGIHIQYDYKFGGRQYQGSNYSVGPFTTRDYGQAERLVDTYVPGKKTTCFVNPSNPSDAILRRGSLVVLPFLLVPLVFIFIGGGGIYVTWRGKPSGSFAGQPRSISTRSSRGVLVAFFSMFLVAGVAATYFTFVRPVLGVERARHWPAVPCRVISSRVQTHSGKSTTYNVDILYSYNVDGREYRSNRYDFMSGSSSGYSSKAIIVAQYRPGTTTKCYVNPSEPTDAVLDRSFQPVMLAGLIPTVFLFIGVGGLIWVFVGGGRGPKLVGQDGDPPWKLREDWACGRIVSSGKPTAIGAWIFAGVWNALSLPVLVILVNEWMRSRDQMLLVGMLFPAIGVGLLVGAIRATARWRKFGDSVFEMSGVPGVVGGALQGTIRLGQPVRTVDGFGLKLSCVNRVTTGAGKNRSTVEHILWTEDQHVEAGLGDRVGVAFYIPPDCRETASDNANNMVIWRLKVTAKDAGVDYTAKFDVPVFKVAQTPQQMAAATAILSRERAAVEHYQPSANSRIRVQPALGGGRNFYFPAMRNVGAGLGLIAFFVIWSAIFWLVVHLKAPLLFPIVWGFVNILIFAGVLHFLSGTTQVVADTSGLTITKKMVGVGRTQVVPAGDVAEIKAGIGMTAGQTTYQNIIVVCQNGRKITAGSAIRDSQEAQWLAAQMLKCVRGQP